MAAAAPASSIVPPSQELLDFYRQQLNQRDAQLYEILERLVALRYLILI
jgi:hypothetical protein